MGILETSNSGTSSKSTGVIDALKPSSSQCQPMDFPEFAKIMFAKPQIVKGTVEYNQENVEKVIEEQHLPSKITKQELYQTYLSEFKTKVHELAQSKRPTVVPKIQKSEEDSRDLFLKRMISQ